MKSEKSEIDNVKEQVSVSESSSEVAVDYQQSLPPFVFRKMDWRVIISLGAVLFLSFLVIQNGANRNAGEGVLDYKFQVDLNNADKAEFQTLPGVGVKLSQSIVVHRDSIKQFNNINELKDVPLIGEKKLAALKPFIKIAPTQNINHQTKNTIP
ncbi:MAG: helix-hairpin-helix domain-containing protein [Planctomycetaceae bacterium]|jgi:competence protein ComEA|nr:helix-hairpin-helix domain-containing protein [Planctomycetaceae bacterium]